MENVTTLLISLVALGIVLWGYIRARKYGQFGLLAWLQSLVLMAPWLLFFGLFSLGIYVDFTATLFLFLISTGIYIYLGRRLRAMGEDPMTRERIAQMMQAAQADAEAAKDKPRTNRRRVPYRPSFIPSQGKSWS
jgi:hypothetical protein